MYVKWINTAVKGAASVELCGITSLKNHSQLFLFFFFEGEADFIGREEGRGNKYTWSICFEEAFSLKEKQLKRSPVSVKCS